MKIIEDKGNFLERVRPGDVIKTWRNNEAESQYFMVIGWPVIFTNYSSDCTNEDTHYKETHFGLILLGTATEKIGITRAVVRPNALSPDDDGPETGMMQDTLKADTVEELLSQVEKEYGHAKKVNAELRII